MQPTYAKQIDEQGDGSGQSDNEEPKNPMNPAGGGVPRTPRQAPDAD